MIGSWAGAMGHTQFMPTSFMKYAVDYRGDGQKDIWNSVPDALASAANYLKEHGWRAGETWGYEVKLPQGFDYSHAWSDNGASVGWWSDLGVTRANGRAFPRASDQARLFMPMGGNGPTFLVLAELRRHQALQQFRQLRARRSATSPTASSAAAALPRAGPTTPRSTRTAAREVQTALLAQGLRHRLRRRRDRSQDARRDHRLAVAAPGSSPTATPAATC